MIKDLKFKLKMLYFKWKKLDHYYRFAYKYYVIFLIIEITSIIIALINGSYTTAIINIIAVISTTWSIWFIHKQNEKRDAIAVMKKLSGERYTHTTSKNKVKI